MAAEVIRKALIVPGRREGTARFEPLTARLRERGVQVAAVVPDWTDHNFSRERIKVWSHVTRLQDDQQNVDLTVIGDDFGGETAWELAARRTGLAKVVAVGARINPEPLIRFRLNGSDSTLDQIQSQRMAPFRDGVKLLTVLPLHDPDLAENEGTFPPDTEGLTRVVHPHRAEYHQTGIEAMLKDPTIQTEIVSFVMDEPRR